MPLNLPLGVLEPRRDDLRDKRGCPQCAARLWRFDAEALQIDLELGGVGTATMRTRPDLGAAIERSPPVRHLRDEPFRELGKGPRIRPWRPQTVVVVAAVSRESTVHPSH